MLIELGLGALAWHFANKTGLVDALKNPDLVANLKQKTQNNEPIQKAVESVSKGLEDIKDTTARIVDNLSQQPDGRAQSMGTELGGLLGRLGQGALHNGVAMGTEVIKAVANFIVGLSNSFNQQKAQHEAPQQPASSNEKTSSLGGFKL